MFCFPCILRLSSTILLLSLLNACANLGELKSVTQVIQPKVKLSDVSVSNFTSDTIDLNIGLNVDNPNSIAIKLAGYEYEVFINNHQFSKGNQQLNTSIAASTTSKTEFPVSLKFSDLFEMAKSLKSSKEMDYEIKSTAYLDLPVIGPVPIRSSSTGRLPVPRTPKLSVNKINLKSMSFTGADLEVVLDVINPNSFAIEVTSLNYQFFVAKQSWASSSIKQTLNLKPDTKNKITIPVSLSLLDMGASIFEVLNGGKEINYQLKGDLKFDTSLPLVKGIQLPINYSAKTQVIKN